MNKTNKQKIKEKLQKMGCTIGCWDEKLEQLSDYSLRKITSKMDEEYTDVKVRINGKHYVVEISTVDSEKDFSLLTRAEYISRYGGELYA